MSEQIETDVLSFFQSEDIWSVKDALEALAIKETVRMSEVCTYM